MSTTNSTIQGRARRRQLTNLGALLLLAAPTAAFSSGCSVEQSAISDGNVGQAEQALTTCVTIKRGAGTVADARISKAAKKQNFGSNPVLQVAEKDETLLRFDLSGIPASAAINSATLKLYSQGQHGNGNGNGHGDDDDDDDHGCGGGDDDENRIRIHRAKASWSEGSVTYKNFNQQYDGATAGILAPSQNSALQSANVKGLVSQWVSGARPNHGFLLEKDDDGKTVFSSSESNNAALRPALEVCYTTPDENHCAPNPCANGTCTNTQNSYTCACDAGWTGTNCDTNIDECAGNPCQNGGACTDGSNSYSCACAPGYAGANCETNINECAGDPCQNGSVCTDGVNSYSCSCEPGFSGTNCETNIDECAGVPCLNDGTCTDGVNGYTCACPTGFTGTNCETDIDDCAAAPCGNGACIDGVNSYTCSCDPGFDGANCENNIDECAAEPCLNGGSCTDGFFSYTCACAPGYEGTNCEIDIDDCAVNPCQNDGICVDGVNQYTCSCPVGWIGTSCETVAIFAPPVTIATGVKSSRRIADFNNDGHLDVLGLDSTTTPLRLSLGNGDGTFQTATFPTANYVSPWGGPLASFAAYTIGDYNGDGNVDFVVCQGEEAPGNLLGQGRLYILGLGNGDGTFNFQDFVLPAPYDNLSLDSLISGDWNGDGNLDLAGFAVNTPAHPFQGLALNLGNGDGTFQSFIDIVSYTGSAFSVQAADFNGDGHLDLAATTDNLTTQVLLGNGDGTFLSPQSYSVADEVVKGITVGDVNGDGAQDLVTLTSANGQSIRPLLNNGDGTFQIGSAFPFNVASVAVGDWDGDGHADVAGTKTASGAVSVRLSNGDGTFQAENVYSGFTAHPLFGPRTITARDFDENGSLDLLVGGPLNGTRFMRNLNVSIDPCNPNPCANGGTCSVDGNSYTCACPAGYTGTNCDVPDVVTCPCNDGGTWTTFVNGPANNACSFNGSYVVFDGVNGPPGYLGYNWCQTIEGSYSLDVAQFNACRAEVESVCGVQFP